MTQEQLDLLRSVAEQDKDNCVSIAILKMIAMIDELSLQACSLMLELETARMRGR